MGILKPNIKMKKLIMAIAVIFAINSSCFAGTKELLHRHDSTYCIIDYVVGTATNESLASFVFPAQPSLYDLQISVMSYLQTNDVPFIRSYYTFKNRKEYKKFFSKVMKNGVKQ